jgi:hypothetical protein
MTTRAIANHPNRVAALAAGLPTFTAEDKPCMRRGHTEHHTKSCVCALCTAHSEWNTEPPVMGKLIRTKGRCRGRIVEDGHGEYLAKVRKLRRLVSREVGDIEDIHDYPRMKVGAVVTFKLLRSSYDVLGENIKVISDAQG